MTTGELNSMTNELNNAIKYPKITHIEDMRSNNQLPKKNEAYSLNCSVMFLDMRNSTYLTKNISKENMTMVYKALTRIVTKSAEMHNGEIRQICGDSFMILFIDKNINERKIFSSISAFECAVTINTYVNNSLKDFCVMKSLEDDIKIGVGIRTGSILMTKVGIKGKDKYQTPVFPGNITNIACKLCNIADEDEIIVDEFTYNHLGEYRSNFNEQSYENIKIYSTKLLWEIN